jgi:hypothetical protein
MLHNFGIIYMDAGYLVWTGIAVLLEWVMCIFGKGETGLAVIITLSVIFSFVAAYGKYYCS